MYHSSHAQRNVPFSKGLIVATLFLFNLQKSRTKLQQKASSLGANTASQQTPATGQEQPGGGLRDVLFAVCDPVEVFLSKGTQGMPLPHFTLLLRFGRIFR